MADKTMVDYTQKIKPYLEGVAPIEPTTTAALAHAVGDVFYLNGELVAATSAIAIGDTIVKTEGSTVGNCEDADDIVTQIKNHTVTTDATPTEGSTNPVQSNGVYVADRNIYEVMGKMGAKNFVALNKSPYKAQSTPNVSSISTQTEDELIFTTANGTFAQVLLFYSLPIGTYKVSCNMSSSDSYSPKVGVYLKNGNQDIRNVKISDGETKEFTITNEITHIEIACLGTEAAATAAVRTVTFRNLMIRLATDTDSTYQPYAKTNKELTADVSSLNTAIANEVETRAKLGAHNRLPLDLATIKSLNTSGTWSGNAYTVNNVTYTVNDDFSITANGTANATAFLALASNIVFKAEDYILSAGSSVDGQYSKYGLYLQRTGQSDITTADDTKKHFVLSNDTVFTNCKIFVVNGESVTNLVFKPMVTLASDPYPEYTPYVPTNAELLPADTNAVLGAHNLLRITGSTSTENGVTYTFNDDGTVTANGTASADSYKATTSDLILKAGTYILSGCPSGGDSSEYRLYVTGPNGTIANDYGQGRVFTLTADTTVSVFMLVMNGKTANYTFKPMIRLASDPSTEYAPYAMTNRELTEDLSGNYVLIDDRNVRYVDITADGTETNETFLKRIRGAAINAIQAALGTDEHFLLISFTYESRAYTIQPAAQKLDYFNDDYFYAVKMEPTLVTIRGIQPFSGVYLNFQFYNGVASITDLKSNTASGTLRVYYRKYKKVV